MISLIVAMDLEGGIGKDGGLPWHLSTDLQRFKQITMGHAIVMGRKTYQSIGRALPGRKNVVISSNPNFEAPGCTLARNMEDSLRIAEEYQQGEIFIIGGAQVFQTVFPQASKIYLTVVNTRAGCQVFFPEFSWNDWKVSFQKYFPKGEKDEFSSTYYELFRENQADF